RSERSAKTDGVRAQHVSDRPNRSHVASVRIALQRSAYCRSQRSKDFDVALRDVDRASSRYNQLRSNLVVARRQLAESDHRDARAGLSVKLRLTAAEKVV